MAKANTSSNSPVKLKTSKVSRPGVHSKTKTSNKNRSTAPWPAPWPRAIPRSGSRRRCRTTTASRSTRRCRRRSGRWGGFCILLVFSDFFLSLKNLSAHSRFLSLMLFWYKKTQLQKTGHDPHGDREAIEREREKEKRESRGVFFFFLSAFVCFCFSTRCCPLRHTHKNSPKKTNAFLY